MEWHGEALVLATRPQGENAALLEVFSPDHGRRSGLIRGGNGRRLTPVLQPGNTIRVQWKARLPGQLGQFTADPVRARAGLVMADRKALGALAATCALLLRALPPDQPQPALYAATQSLLEALISVPDWPLLYLHWELGLLRELGFGLDLSRCAVTGATQGLAFVSPKTGRAVTWEGAGEWHDRLLPLPACLTRPMAAMPAEISQGLTLTGHFLTRALRPDAGAGKDLPEARLRLAGLFAQTPGQSPHAF